MILFTTTTAPGDGDLAPLTTTTDKAPQTNDVVRIPAQQTSTSSHLAVIVGH
jgi:hypothetical protein